jgi:hypothetical protein
MKRIDNKAMRYAVDALLRAKSLEAEAKELRKAAKEEVIRLTERAGIVLDSENTQAKILVRGVRVTLSYVSGRQTIDSKKLREQYPAVAERFTKIGTPFVKVDPTVVDTEEAITLVA